MPNRTNFPLIYASHTMLVPLHELNSGRPGRIFGDSRLTNDAYSIAWIEIECDRGTISPIYASHTTCIPLYELNLGRSGARSS